MWYPIIFIAAMLGALIIVLRRALWLGPPVVERGVKVELETGDSNESEVVYARARAERLFSERKYFAAEKWYKEVVHLKPDDDRTWARLGVIAVSQRRYEDGVEALRRSISMNDRVPSRYYNLALAYFLSGQKRRSLATINQALTIAPERANYLDLKEKIGRSQEVGAKKNKKKKGSS